MATIKRQLVTGVGKNVDKLEFSHAAGRNVKQYRCFGK